MVRNLSKIKAVKTQEDVEKELEDFEKNTNNEIEKIEKQRQKDFSTELDCGFYFSVVFNSRIERDEWLQKHNLKLEEDFFIKAKDFNL